MRHINNFNKSLEQAGLKFRLAKGKGYFYYYALDDETEVPDSIYIYAFSHGSPEFWESRLEEAITFNKANNETCR